MKKLKESYINDLNTAINATVDITNLFNSNVLITGATGLIGSFLVDMLLLVNSDKKVNINIYALARNGNKLKNRFTYTNSPALHFIVQDVCDEITIVDDIDYIIHAAGDGYPLAFKDHPVETMTPAVLGTLNTLDLAKKKSVKSYLYISSGEIYGARLGENRPFKEHDLYNAASMSPRSCYPVGKQAGEILCVCYASEYFIPAKVARLSHIYGAATAEGDNRASTQFIKSASRKEEIVLYSKGEAVRSYTYIADAASAIFTILLNGESGQAYNVANPESIASIADFADILANIAGVKCRFVLPDETEIMQASPISYAVLDSTKLQDLGWIYRYTIADGLKATLENI